MPAIPSISHAGPPAGPPPDTLNFFQSVRNTALAIQIPLLASLVLLGACWRCHKLLARRMDRTPEKVPSASDTANDTACGSSPQTDSPPINPVYPWIAPPKPLPGPYDPRLLPPLLPNPTIRQHSNSDATAADVEIITATYTRRVSAHGDEGERVLYGHVIKAGTDGGWRRNQWSVQAG